jgi:hypothetical protein
VIFDNLGERQSSLIQARDFLFHKAILRPLSMDCKRFDLDLFCGSGTPIFGFCSACWRILM